MQNTHCPQKDSQAKWELHDLSSVCFRGQNQWNHIRTLSGEHIYHTNTHVKSLHPSPTNTHTNTHKHTCLNKETETAGALFSDP